MRNKTLFLTSIALIAILITLFIKPIQQDPGYHEFADKRTVFGIVNAFNVLSNFPFIILGLLGIVFIWLSLRQRLNDYIFIQYLVFFMGIFLTGIGSCYYHLSPSNDTLLWDRLPMSISFMAFFCVIISELISLKTGSILFVPLLIIGISSVFYWYWSEKHGIGDLRMYALVQFLPMILIPLILFMYKCPRNYLCNIMALMVFYVLSKIFEILDTEVYELGKIISGHTLKHLFAATSIYFIIRMVYIRKKEIATECI